MFGSTNKFGSSSPFRSQPMLGQMSGTKPFGTSNSNPFGVASTSSSSASSSPSSSSSPFTGYSGQKIGSFNQTNPFSSTGSAFSVSSSPAFGASSGFAFGASSSPALDASSSFSFGASSSSAFVFGSTPAFSNPFSFGSKNEAYKWMPHDEQSEPSALTGGAGFQRTTSSIFGQTVSNTNPFSSTSQPTPPNTSSLFPSSITQSNLNPSYSSTKQSNPTSFSFTSESNQNKNQNPTNVYPFCFTSQSKENPFSFTSQLKENQNPNPFSFSPQSNPNSNTNSFSFSSQSNKNQNQNQNPFASFVKDSNQNPFSNPFAPTPSPSFSSSSTFSSNPSVFGSLTTPETSPPMIGTNANTTQGGRLVQCTAPAFGKQASNGSWSGPPAFVQATSSRLTTASSSVSTPSSFEAMPTGQTSSVFSFGNNNLDQPSQGGIGGSASTQPVASETGTATQAAPSVNLFGTLRSVPQVSLGLSGTISSVQYGISSLPVGEKSAPSRGSFPVPRHLSQRRVRLPLRRYHTKTDAPKVAFYAQRQEASYAPNLDAVVIPRQNPRKVTITDPEIVNNDDWLRDEVCDVSPSHLEDHVPVPDSPTTQNDDIVSSGEQSDSTASPSFEQEDNQDDCDLNLDENDEKAPPPSTSDCNHSTQKGLQAAIVYEHGAEIEALMPKLRHADYYTEPRIQDLAARERADPGFCSRVPGFVVGRNGYGCIKFSGETDVRKLDLEAIVQFGNKEVVVYRDEKKKPAVGQGLNKPAEVALLNIKCINKKTGERYLAGPKVQRYKEMLAKKTLEQGGEFISYDPVKAEWRFKVKHFSRYGLFLPPH